MRSTHSDRLERYLGPATVERISKGMQGWYGPKIAVSVPGNVWATPDGDFVGEVRWGSEVTWMDYARDFARRLNAAARAMTKEHRLQLGVGGFTSVSDIINNATVNGYRQDLWYQKVGVTGVANATSSLWYSGNLPQAGGNASAASAGRACTSSTTGAANALINGSTWTGSARAFITTAYVVSSAQNTLLAYDRLFDVAKTMSSTTTESVTGVPTRYTSTTSTDPDYVAGNFLFVEVGTANMGATGHNWTVCTYKDEGGNSSTLPSLTGNSGCIAQRIDHPTNQWFAPLEAGDAGIKALTQMQCSASVTASGGLNFVIGHPLVWVPTIAANQCYVYDGINTSFNMVRVFDNACISFLEVNKPATTATTYNGSLTIVSG